MELTSVQGQSSVADILIRLMPGLEVRFRPARDTIDPLAAKTLFSLWKNESNKVADNTYRRPPTMAAHQIDAMSKAGLARSIGDKIEITEKGARVLRIMLLGDDHSVFDNDDRIIDYAQALSNTKIARRKGTTKCAGDWWKRFESDNILVGSIWREKSRRIHRGRISLASEFDQQVSIVKYDEDARVVLIEASGEQQFFNVDEFLDKFDLLVE